VKSIVKKAVIYSMIGIIQLGLGASVIEASPLHNDFTIPQQYNSQDQNRHESRDNDQDRQERVRAENKKHEQEMKQRPNENKKHWNERQKQEKERHDKELRNIQEHR
jgi:membrane protein involved in colicin uptake